MNSNLQQVTGSAASTPTSLRSNWERNNVTQGCQRCADTPSRCYFAGVVSKPTWVTTCASASGFVLDGS